MAPLPTVIEHPLYPSDSPTVPLKRVLERMRSKTATHQKKGSGKYLFLAHFKFKTAGSPPYVRNHFGLFLGKVGFPYVRDLPFANDNFYGRNCLGRSS